MAIYERICRECGMNFQGGPRAWYCPDCRKKREKERVKKYRKDGFQRHFGDTDYCQHCGKPYVVHSGLQRYCKECSAINQKLVDRRQSLAYYYANKNVINPKRNERRHVLERMCIVCGSSFRPKGQQKICSTECRKIWIRDLNRLIYSKRHRWKRKNSGKK